MTTKTLIEECVESLHWGEAFAIECASQEHAIGMAVWLKAKCPTFTIRPEKDEDNLWCIWVAHKQWKVVSQRTLEGRIG